MERFRQHLLESTTKESDLIEMFSVIDRDRSGRISFEEFSGAVKALKIKVDGDEEIKDIFRQFDATKNGQIDFYEFLQQLRPPMSERRQKVVSNMFDSLDVNKDGTLTVADLKMKFADRIQAKKKKSDKAVNQTLQNFLNKFDTPHQADGAVDKREFFGFCSMLSATIRDDIYFEHVLRMLTDFHL